MTPADLKTIRDALGLTQQALADRLDVHRVTVAKWETGAQPIPQIAQLAVMGLAQNEGEKE